MGDQNINIEETNKPKKRPVLGRTAAKIKRRRLSDHVTGPNCECSRLKCFENVTFEERNRIIAHVNALPSKDEQDSFFSGLINVAPVQRRRSRKHDETSTMHDYSCQYHLNVSDNGLYRKIPVCLNGFCSILGITKGRVHRITKTLSETGIRNFNTYICICFDFRTLFLIFYRSSSNR